MNAELRSAGGTAIGEGPLMPCTRRAALEQRIEEVARMVGHPHLFSPCEALGHLLGATRLAFAIAGEGEEGTQRRQLYDAIDSYVEQSGTDGAAQ